LPCSICRKAEKGASEDSIYICSRCTAILGSVPKSESRTIVDKLYLAGRAEDAQFVERILTGEDQSTSEVPKLIKRKVPLKRRR